MLLCLLTTIATVLALAYVIAELACRWRHPGE